MVKGAPFDRLNKSQRSKPSIIDLVGSYGARLDSPLHSLAFQT